MTGRETDPRTWSFGDWIAIVWRVYWAAVLVSLLVGIVVAALVVLVSMLVGGLGLAAL